MAAGEGGRIAVDGGWRIYSSGPGIYVALVVQHALGVRRRFGKRISKRSLASEPETPAAGRRAARPLTRPLWRGRRSSVGAVERLGPRRRLKRGRALAGASAAGRTAGEPQAFLGGGQHSFRDPLAEPPPRAERVLDDQRDINARAAGIDAPAAVDGDFAASYAAPTRRSPVAVAERRVAAAEIRVALAQGRVPQLIRHGDRICDEQRVPQRVGCRPWRSSLPRSAGASGRTSARFRGRRRPPLRPSEDRLRAAAISERPVHQPRAVGKRRCFFISSVCAAPRPSKGRR